MRKSPFQSATLYKVGTKKRGIDKNIWIVVINKNKIKRWKLFKKLQKIKNIKNTKKILRRKKIIKTDRKKIEKTENTKKTEIQKLLESQKDPDNGKLRKLTKIGKFNVNSKVIVGDVIYSITDLIKGTYKAYRSAHNLLIVHESVDSVKNIDFEWIKTKYIIGVDTGQFGFYDLDTVQYINKLLSEKMKNSLPTLKYNSKTDRIINPSMVENLNEIDKKFMKNKYGVVGSTHGGDGFFNMYIPKDKNLSQKIALLAGYTYTMK